MWKKLMFSPLTVIRVLYRSLVEMLKVVRGQLHNPATMLWKQYLRC